MNLSLKILTSIFFLLLIPGIGFADEKQPITKDYAKEELQAGDLASALKAYDQLINESPYSAEIWNNRGVTLLRLGRCNEALSSFNTVIELNSSLLSGRINAAEASSCLGNINQTIQYLQDATTINSENPFLWKELAYNYRQTGDLNNTVHSYEKAYELNQSDTEVQYLLAETFYFNGDYKNSSEIYTQIISHSPDDENAWYNLGVNYEAMQQYKSAVDAYNKTVSLNSSNFKTWANMGNIYWRHNRYAEAQEAMKKVVELHPDSDSLFDLALVEKSLGNLNESQELFNKASSLAPNDTMKKAYAEKYDRLYQQNNPDTSTTPSSANPIGAIICGLIGVALIWKFHYK